jgi:predicted Zn finger-like uncharacterized protein
MTIRCPKCRTPSLLSASDVGKVGRLVRCPACETTWLARHFADDGYEGRKSRAPEPMVRREPLIIEAEVIPSVRFTTASPGGTGVGDDIATAAAALASRYRVAVGATALIAMLVAVILLTPAFSPLQQLSAMFSGGSGIALQGVSSRTVKLRGTDAILVEGEIVNRTSREMDVPAVRIALKQGGSEVYSWLLEPTVLRVAAGDKVGFRSAMASPRPGATQVALSLAGRGATPSTAH